MSDKLNDIYKTAKHSGVTPMSGTQAEIEAGRLGRQAFNTRKSLQPQEPAPGAVRWDLSYIDVGVRIKIGLAGAVIMPILLLLYTAHIGTLDVDYFAIIALGVVSGFVAGWLIELSLFVVFIIGITVLS